MLIAQNVKVTYLVSDNAVPVLVQLVINVTYTDIENNEARTQKTSLSMYCLISVNPVKPRRAARSESDNVSLAAVVSSLHMRCCAGRVCCGRDGNGSHCSQFPQWHGHNRYPETVRVHRGNMQKPTLRCQILDPCLPRLLTSWPPPFMFICFQRCSQCCV